jgi:CheY-like chemotaxis protein
METDRSRPVILIVDDEADIVEYLRIVLEDSGYSVVGAGDVEKARAVLETTVPCLVLLDVMMPGQSGFTLYREIKEREETKKTPVLLISGYAKAGDFARTDLSDLKEAGFPLPDGYLEKPISAEELLKNIKPYIGCV